MTKRSKNKEKGNTNRIGEGQMYDKIMRENLLELFLPLVAEQLNIEMKSVTPLVDKQPTTVIRETDSFLLIETYSKSEPKFVLHLEFESSDDAEMVFRIGEHHGIELRKYRLPMKHVVVYLGEKPPKMRTQLHDDEIYRGFTLVDVHSFSPQKWLVEEEPAKIIMAILSDYQKKNARIILEAIFTKLRKVCKNETELKKFIKQLIIISSPDSYRERNLEKLSIKISEEMPITIDVEKDYLYNLGYKKAEEKAKAEAELEIAKFEEAKKALAEAQKLAELEQKAKSENEKLTKEFSELEERAMKEAENAKREAEKAHQEKKTAIQKMKATDRFTDDEIMEFLNLDVNRFNTFIKEIEKEQAENQSEE